MATTHFVLQPLCGTVFHHMSLLLSLHLLLLCGSHLWSLFYPTLWLLLFVQWLILLDTIIAFIFVIFSALLQFTVFCGLATALEQLLASCVSLRNQISAYCCRHALTLNTHLCRLMCGLFYASWTPLVQINSCEQIITITIIVITTYHATTDSRCCSWQHQQHAMPRP